MTLRLVLLAATALALPPLAAVAQTVPGPGPNPAPKSAPMALTAPAPTSPATPAPAAALAAAPAAPSTSAPPPTAAPIAAPQAAPADAGSDQAVRVLVEQANFWRGQYQPDRAMTAVNRALRLDPNNAAALALLAQLQSERGDRGAAQGTANKLRQVAPNDPSLASVDLAVRMGPIDQAALTQARDLARQGHTAEAIAAYKQVFHGTTPPRPLAIEYYQVLSGTEGGWQAAREGLGHAVIADPDDLHGQLAYAQLLTYRDQTRAEGISRLQALAANPAIADAAAQSLRQALLWLPDTAASVPSVEAYLQIHPDDPQVQQKLKTAQNPPQTGPVDTGGQARVAAYAALNGGKLDDAADAFQRALQVSPTDADALGGLGLVRLRQGRTAEGRALLERAIAADPSRRRNWEAALSGLAAASDWAEVRALSTRGDTAGAERTLKRLMGRNPNAGTWMLLADLQQRNGELADSEASYRRALALTPRNADALIGLGSVLAREDKDAEAEQVYAQAEAAGARAQAGRARADLLAARAQAAGDPAAQLGLYEAALAQDPDNPWLRLALARVLVRQGRLPAAQGVIQQGVDSPRAPPDALLAGVYFYQETDDPQAASALIARLPARSRTPEMRSLQDQVAFDQQLRTLTADPDPAEVRSRLLALAAAPDPEGTRGAAIAHALTGLGDKAGARAAIVAALMTARNPTPAQRIAYAGALMGAGQTADAYQLVSSVDPARVPPAQAEAAQRINAGIAVQSSDALNGQGHTADAYDRLVPALDRTPADPDLNMALARLYQTRNRTGDALRIDQALLARDPSSLPVRQAAIGAAIANGSYALASQWVREGLQMFPNDPRAYMGAADLAQAQGNRGAAIRFLLTARQLRQQQLGFESYQPVAAGPRVSRDLPPGARPAAFVTDMPANDLPPPAVLLPGSPMPGGGPLPGFVQDGPYRVRGAPVAADGAAMQGAGLDDMPADIGVRAPVRRIAYARDDQGMMLAQSVPVDDAAPSVPRGTLPPGQTAQPTQSSALPAYQVPYQPPYQAPATTGPVLFQPPPPAYNPFRSASAATPDLPASLGGSGGPGGYGVVGYVTPQPADPLTQQLDTQIATLRDQIAPTVQPGAELRFRSGSPGLDELTEAMVPVEATFSPGGTGTLKFSATPTYLSAGSIGSNPQSRSQFGAAGLYALSPTTPSPGYVTANGVGLDAGYNFQWVSADIGTSPLGFRTHHITGGIELAPELATDFRLRLTAENRAVTDSVLSYAGVRDPVTGTLWGGVERTRGHVQLEYAPGSTNFYLGAGGASLTGTHVQSNTEIEAGAGGSAAFYKTPTDEARAGLDLVYFGYDHNERIFSLGGGGYFSPEHYLAAIVPVTYTHKDAALTWSAGASLGLESYKEASNVYFPLDPALQAQLESIAAIDSQVTATYPSRSTTGVVGGVNGSIEYKMTPSFVLGGRASFQRAGDWNEAQALLYGRYVFNGVE